MACEMANSSWYCESVVISAFSINALEYSESVNVPSAHQSNAVS